MTAAPTQELNMRFLGFVLIALTQPLVAQEAVVLKAARMIDPRREAGNPLEDVCVFENVRFVMKGGVVYKSP
jgi:hypothetical protein